MGLRFFREGFKLFLEWRIEIFSWGEFFDVTSRELNIFHKGLRVFGEIENFSSVGVEAFS